MRVTISVALLWATNGHAFPIVRPSTRLYSEAPSDHTNPSNADQTPANSGSDDAAALKGSRFSKFAPDTSLEAENFRAQLRENMKANLEERRRKDPKRGNQPAKNYLDGL